MAKASLTLPAPTSLKRAANFCVSCSHKGMAPKIAVDKKGAFTKCLPSNSKISAKSRPSPPSPPASTGNNASISPNSEASCQNPASLAKFSPPPFMIFWAEAALCKNLSVVALNRLRSSERLKSIFCVSGYNPNTVLATIFF